MVMKMTQEEFLGVEELDPPSPEVLAEKMSLEFEASVFLRMKELGIKQKDLADALGLSAATVSKTLSKHSNMTFKTAARIAHALGCTIEPPRVVPFKEIPSEVRARN